MKTFKEFKAQLDEKRFHIIGLYKKDGENHQLFHHGQYQYELVHAKTGKSIRHFNNSGHEEVKDVLSKDGYTERPWDKNSRKEVENQYGNKLL